MRGMGIVLVVAVGSVSWALYRLDTRATELVEVARGQAAVIDTQSRIIGGLQGAVAGLEASVGTLAESADRQSRAIDAAADTLSQLESLDALLRSGVREALPPARTTPTTRKPTVNEPSTPPRTTTTTTHAPLRPAPLPEPHCIDLVILEVCA